MRVYIEYFQQRNSEISRRLNEITTPVRFRPVISTRSGRIGYGLLESTDVTELEKVKKNLIDLINTELNEDEFAEKIKEENENAPRQYWDPVFEGPINIFTQKSTEDILTDLELNKYNDSKD
jgi:hypothetical protein